MKIVKTVAEIKDIIRNTKKQGQSIGLVPTMGYLHQGHLTLMREAKKKTDFVVASIFVNPIQFGAGEDYEVYPRDLDRDSALAESAGVDVIFAPSVNEMYPSGFKTFVEVTDITDKLCGKSRPGHFKGVATVVSKLFNIVEPDAAFFGQKDAQQVVVLKRMVEDLNMNLKIEMVPIVREADGLAMSSRNSYLNQEERAAATVLFRSLGFARELISSGEHDAEKVKSEVARYIHGEPLAKADYVELLTFPELEQVAEISGKVIIALAVFIGKTRLIDNLVLEV